MISVIICTHKLGFIHECIQSIKQSRGIEYELLIMSSVPEITQGWVETFFRNYVPAPERIEVIECQGEPAYRRNLGASHAHGDIFVFLDDDVNVGAYCIQELIRPFNLPKIGMTYGKLKNAERVTEFDDCGDFISQFGFLYSRGDREKDEGQYNRYEAVLAGKSATCAIRRDVFNSVGGFDESFGILGEETDLSWRVWLAGFAVLYVPKALGWHWFNTSRKDFSFYSNKRVYYNGCRNYITMLKKNASFWFRFKVLPIQYLAWFTASMLMLVTGKLSPALAILRGMWYTLGRRYQNGANSELVEKTVRRSIRVGYFVKKLGNYIRTGLHG